MAGTSTKPIQARTSVSTPTVGNAVEFVDTTNDVLGLPAIKRSDGTTVSPVVSVSGTPPIASSGGTSPAISITAATGGAAGSMSASDKTKLDTMTSGAAVASVGATAPATSTGGTTPNIGVQVSPGAATTVVGTTRQLNTTAPITGGGDLSADRTIAISAATANPSGAAGSMSAVDKTRMQQVYDAQADFGFVGDLRTTSATSSMAGSSAILTDTSNPFVAGDVGKRITVPRAGAGASPNIAQLTTTILSFQSAGQVTLNATATNAVSGVSVTYGTDNTAAITTMVNTVNNAVYASPRIVFGESATNAYGFPASVVFNKTCQIEGVGGGHTADSGDYTKIGGTRLAWWGTSSDGGTAFQAFFTWSPTGAQAIKHPAFRRCWLDCRNNDQNQALFGVKFASCHGFILEDFFVMDPLAASIWTDIATSPTEAKDCTRWSIRDFCSRNLDNPPVAMTTPILMGSGVTLTTTPQNLTVAANTLPTSGYLWTMSSSGAPVLVNYTGGGGTTTLTGCTISTEFVVHTPLTVANANVVQAVPGNGCAFYMNGGTAANTAIAVVEMAQLSIGTTWGPAAIELYNADSIDFIQVIVNGGNVTNDGAINRIRKPGMRCNGSIVSATLAARNITLRGGSMGAGGLSCMGANNAGARLLAQSGPTYADLYQLGNGEGLPVVELNAFLQWAANGGLVPGKIGTALVTQQASIPAATATLINGSIVPMPVAMMWQAGTTIRWKVLMSKTAAGVAARTFFIHLGTGGVVGDAIIATFTNAAVGTAAAGNALLEVIMTIRTVPSPAGAGATAIAYAILTNNGDTGFLTTGCDVTIGTMATFNTATAQQFLSLSVTTGAAEVISVDQCFAECEVGANP